MYAFGMPRSTPVDPVERAMRARTAPSHATAPHVASPTIAGVDRGHATRPTETRSTPILDKLRRRAHDLVVMGADTDDLLAHMFADVGVQGAGGPIRKQRAARDRQAEPRARRDSGKSVVTTTEDSFGYAYFTPMVTSRRDVRAAAVVAERNAQGATSSDDARTQDLPSPNQPDPVTGAFPMPGQRMPTPVNHTGLNQEWIHFRSTYYDMHRIITRVYSTGNAPLTTIDRDSTWQGFKKLFVAIDSMFMSTDFKFYIERMRTLNKAPPPSHDALQKQSSSLPHMMTLNQMRNVAARHGTSDLRTFYLACVAFVRTILGVPARIDPTEPQGSWKNPRPSNFSAFVNSPEFDASAAKAAGLTVDSFVERRTDPNKVVHLTVREEVIAGAQLFFYYQQLFYTAARSNPSEVPWLQATIGPRQSMYLVPSMIPTGQVDLTRYTNRQGLASRVFHHISLYPTSSYLLLLPSQPVAGRGDDSGLTLRDVPREDTSFPERPGYTRKQYTFNIGLPLTLQVDRSFERSNIVLFIGDYFLGYFLYDHYTNPPNLLDQHNAQVDNVGVPYDIPMAARLVKLGGYTHVKNEPSQAGASSS